jgi:hypothetical protein
MARPAKTLLAGAISAIPLLSLLCGAATSQTVDPSQVINNQIQLGDVFTSGTLTVVTAADVQSQSSATGNAVVAGADGADMAVTSNQTMAGSALSQTVVDMTTSRPDSVYLSNAATGNAADAFVSGATLTGVITQQTDASPAITARSQIEGVDAQAGDLTQATSAAGNSTTLDFDNGAGGVRVNQTSGASVLADGGAIVQYVSGTADVSGQATGNSVISVGQRESAERLAIYQSNSGALVQASKFTAYGNANTTTTSTVATGNQTATINQGALLDVDNTQSNAAYVRSQSEATSYQFGGATVDATATGNSVLAGNFGPEVVLANDQFNGAGGVEAIASFQGQDGYDATVRANAIGNDATAYACSECTGTVDVNSRQVNQGDVAATATLTAGGTARSLYGVSTAVGNNASFYVSRPNGN